MLDFKSVIEFLKFTILLPIGLLVYQLEKLGSIRKEIDSYVFWLPIILLTFSIMAGLYCIMSLTAATSYEKALKNESDEEKIRVYTERLSQNLTSIRFTGPTHTLTLLIGAVLLFGIVISHLEELYRKPDNNIELTVSIDDAGIVSTLTKISQYLKDIQKLFETGKANNPGVKGENCNVTLTDLTNRLNVHDLKLQREADENTKHLDRHLDILAAKIAVTCSKSRD